MPAWHKLTSIAYANTAQTSTIANTHTYLGFSVEISGARFQWAMPTSDGNDEIKSISGMYWNSHGWKHWIPTNKWQKHHSNLIHIVHTSCTITDKRHYAYQLDIFAFAHTHTIAHKQLSWFQDRLNDLQCTMGAGKIFFFLPISLPFHNFSCQFLVAVTHHHHHHRQYTALEKQTTIYSSYN